MKLSLQQPRPAAGSLVPSAPVAAQLRHVHNVFARLNRRHVASRHTRTAPAAAAAAVASTAATASVEPQLAAALWSMPYAPTRIHVVYGTPASITEIIPLQLEDLRPASVTKPALLEFLQSNLTTRAASQKGVQCMVLSSSAYLPSQLDTISSLARGIGISVALCTSRVNKHILFMPSLAGLEIDEWRQRVASITQSTCELLAPTFGKMQQLSEERLADARDAEQMLNRQLRLWHAPSWGATLQQELESNRAWRRWMAVRSLMGPPSLAAARKLIERKGMYMVELQLPLAEMLPAVEQAPAANDAAAAASPSR
uniref:Uncharacterized protein n=1 Tax=Tetradesmus obliquus TaxID=3088 RepID=A0A383WB22_TETOB|eukprot:jgi/Sobl393_1/2803/SZX73886.1